MKFKIKYIYLIALPVILAVLFFSAFSIIRTDEKPDAKGNEKILKFSHSLHKDLAECDVCHAAVKTSKSLNDRLLPNHEVCKTCHEEVDKEDKCQTCHYGENYEPLKQHRSKVLFDHSFHLDKEKLKCDACHKGISDVDYAFKSVQPYTIMENCYSCHNSKAIATSACEGCHISTANLKPQSHMSSNFIKSHKFASKEPNANCAMCHDNVNNSCISCHAANNIIAETNLPDFFYQPATPNNFIDGTKQQQNTRVHDPNYVYTHGMDVKGKTSECQTCHETKTFCANCHASNKRDFSMGGVTPLSHVAPDFLTIGVGTGGGQHAILARRDIETCVACHDVNGSDPTCITCHVDPDGIRGTNPRTHPDGFMHNTHGDWHDTDASVCFNCHTSQNHNSPRGIGFCGYCHGK